jgi:hypothetical protein
LVVRKLILGNVDYRVHMSDENEQLQCGLVERGWEIAGVGYDDGLCDVPDLLLRHKPDIVLCMDKRDWDPECVAKRPDLAFTRIGVLAERHDLLKLTIIKDAGTFQKEYKAFFEEIVPDVAVSYYEEGAVRRLNTWLREDQQFIRIHHSVDADLIRKIGLEVEREGVLVSGARGWCYPMRNEAVRRAPDYAWDVLPHPGHHNRGVSTIDYLTRLVGYKVHIATATIFGFALRKIMESVACGCTCVTDLPATDALPVIDDYLERVPQGSSVSALRQCVSRSLADWNLEERKGMAEKALVRYDYHEVCRVFDEQVDEIMKRRTQCQ